MAKYYVIVSVYCVVNKVFNIGLKSVILGFTKISCRINFLKHNSHSRSFGRYNAKFLPVNPVAYQSVLDE